MRVLALLIILRLAATSWAQTAVTEEVSYSRVSGLISDSVSLDVSPPSTAGGTIRYTLDNTEPQETSPAWPGPISISESAIVRTRIFAPGLAPGPVTSRQFLRLDESLVNYREKGVPFSSSLPLIVVGTFGADIDSTRDPQFVYTATVLPDATTTRAQILGPPDYEGRGSMHLRGESSIQFDQKSYAWETRDELGGDDQVSVLGFPEESDWVLYAPYNDKTLMRNFLAYSQMRALRGNGSAMRTRFCEVFVNRDGRVRMDDYRGVYVFIEKIKRDKNRIDVAELESTDTDGALISGGYIFRKDKPSDDYAFTTAAEGIELQVREPSEPNAAQKAYLESYLNAFETALHGPDFANPTTGYASFIDPLSFIDNQWFVEIAKQIDGYRFSSYFHKDRGRKIGALPIWDYNFSLGNATLFNGARPTGWYYEQLSGTDYPWYPRLHEDPLFELHFWDRYWTLRHGVLSPATLTQEISRQRNILLEGRAGPVTNKTSLSIQTPAARHFRRWPVLGKHVLLNAPGAANRKTYQSEVSFLVNFINRRLRWIDRQNAVGQTIFRPPRLSRPSGSVSPGSVVRITRFNGAPPPGKNYAAGPIYYTLDGSDPRGADGQPRGVKYTQPLTIAGTSTLKARLFAKSHWSPLAEATYLAGAVPATPENIVVSELMYHAAAPSADEIADGLTDDSVFDWIEIANIGSLPVDLSTLQFNAGLTFDLATAPLASRVLPAGASAVVVANRAGFARRYPAVPETKILGEFTGSLSNGGEQITLATAEGTPISSFTYDDSAPWPVAPDGNGPSLEVSEPALHPSLSSAASWRVSSSPSGSPGEL